MNARITRCLFLSVASILLAIGCAAQPTNPSFPITQERAHADMARMAAEPRALQRPLVVIGGIFDPAFGTTMVRWGIDPVISDRRIIYVTLAECLTFDSCREKVVDAVEREFPSKDSAQTIEVDVIGLSLGGLVARYSALPLDEKHGKHLHIVRLFTVSSPHRGAVDADIVPALHPLIIPLRPGSDLVKQINATAPPYPVFPYVRLNDRPVGEINAAPPGQTAWWLSTPHFSDPHCGAFGDERILADISRRLRGEAPLTTEPPSPLPAKG